MAQSLPFNRQALHAFALSLQHPLTQEFVSWFKAPPADLLQLLPILGMTPEDLPEERAVLSAIHQGQSAQ